MKSDSLSVSIYAPESDDDLRRVLETLCVCWEAAPRVALSVLAERLDDFEVEYLTLCLKRLELIGVLDLEKPLVGSQLEIVFPVRFQE